MIIEIPNENSIVKWKNDDKDEWKIAEISDLIKAYERPQGKWVEVERQGRTGDGRVFTYTIIVCSNCGEQFDLEGEKFCPHCGAKMQKGGDS